MFKIKLKTMLNILYIETITLLNTIQITEIKVFKHKIIYIGLLVYIT